MFRGGHSGPASCLKHHSEIRYMTHLIRHWKTAASFFFAGVMAASLMFIGIADRGPLAGITSIGGGYDSVSESARYRNMQDTLPSFTAESIREAEKLYGLSFSDAHRDSMMKDVITQLGYYEELRGYDIGNDVMPAMHFDPMLPWHQSEEEQHSIDWMLDEQVELPDEPEELAFYPVEKLAVLIQSGAVTSEELTRMFLERIRRYDDELKTVVTLTDSLALAQARRADREIAEGNYRGLLHGIPYGTKDLLDLKGYPASWGSKIYAGREPDYTAAVISKLEAAGAVHVAKLSLGELAWGDVWFGGMTRTPWNTQYGSSGSSAGSASAVAAGLIPFSIGSETLGSIISPATRNGVTGFRPTFGRVSRQGVMALSWSMDKIGPVTRSAHDAAIVFDAIYGPANRTDASGDGGDATGSGYEKDPSVRDIPFNYDPEFDFENKRIGYIADAFESEHGYHEFDKRVLEKLRDLGAELVPVSLPEITAAPMRIILNVEAAAAFDEVTRSGKDTMMVRQVRDAWPNVFRAARFVPAVEYIQANRIRTLLMKQMDEAISDVDVYVSPSFVGGNLQVTNLTGHPSVSVPTGFDVESGLPVSITFNGHLYDEGTVLSLARAWQMATGYHEKIPPDFAPGSGERERDE